MKNLITKVSVIGMILLSSSVYGQRFGVKAGLNLSEMSVKDNTQNFNDDFTVTPGYNLGLIMVFPRTGNLHLETGLNLNSKGYKFEGPLVIDDRTFIVKEKVHLDYLDLPLNLNGTYPVSDKFILHGNLGAYIGMGLNGNVTREMDVDGGTLKDKSKIDWGSDDSDDLKRFDFGLNFGVGVERARFILGANYGLGLVNLLPTEVNGSRASNRAFGISLGYMFD